jgi:signal transduction histidine kinase/CheY-like chemotaxis protein
VLALTLAAGTTGIAGVAALESHVRRSAEGELQSLLNAQVTELTTNLELRASRAEIVTTRPNLRRVLRILVAEPSNRDARQVVHGVLASFLSHDFSLLVASRPGGEEIARAGNDATDVAALDVPLDGSGRARLVWRDGVGLRHELTMTDAEGLLGSVVVEQRLPQITEMLTSNQTRFASAEFLLCSAAGPAFRCFPSRLSTTPVVVPPGPRGAPRLMQRALAEGAGVSTTVDYRGHEVFGAYTPLPTLGLVAVLKVDVDELYGPALRQLGLALFLVLIVTLGGVALVRARVGPLATHLERRVQQRTAGLEQANARLSILHEIDRGLIAAKNLEGIAETTLRQLRDLLGVSRVIVNLFDLEGGKVEWLAAVGRRRVHVGPGVRFPLALMGNVDALRRGEPQVIDVDALPSSPDAEALLKSGVHVYMVVPMISRGELIGGLSFGGSSREFPPDQITIAEEVARQMAIAIDHSRLLERVTRYSGELEERVRERTLELSAANTQLQREAAERQRAEAEAERANRAKSEFLSRMSHELRTPLNSVIGFGQLLELGAQSPEQRESVGHILKGGRHLLALINEVLDLARIEAGKLSLSIEAVFLEDVVRGALDLVRPQAAARKVRLPERLAWDCQVMADRQRLQQVLLNLLSNAIKYNREGGSIAVEHTEAPSGRTRLAITDTGAGITPAMLERLFTPFDRLGADQSGVEGTGLGLALSKRLVEAMAGSLAVESRPGEGTTCTIELPTAVRAEVPAVASGDGVGAAERPCSRGTVLYIEDNLANLRLVERVVSLRPGVALLSAMQGRQGLELARAHRPDLIVLDLHLPDLPGTEVLAQLVVEPDTRKIPVVILSADATPNQTARLRAQGAHAYLTKPLDVKALLTLLDEVLT